MFGGRSVSDVTLLNVDVRVRTEGGKEAWGFGSMPLGNAWAFPNVPFDVSLGAMRALADDLRRITADCTERGHPIDLARVLDPEFLRAAEAVSRSRSLPVSIPKLCTLVVSSPFDAALHDAYGKVFGVSAYATYTREFMTGDLSRDLGPEFKGEYLDRYVPQKPRATMPVFHSVGASDPIEAVRREAAVERWPAGHARGVDPARWPDSLQDQVERRQPARWTTIASSASIGWSRASCRRVA